MRGQVWIETVLYTLIGLALIGVTLVIVTPKINESRDRILVEQTIDSLNSFDERVDILNSFGEGNVRIIPEFTIGRGEFFIDPVEDRIYFILDEFEKPYSEPGVDVRFGEISVSTTDEQSHYSVTLDIDYTGVVDLTYAGSDTEVGKFTPASIPYSFIFENLGTNSDGLFVVNIVESGS